MSTDFHQLEISAVERLTKDAVAVSFDIPDALKEAFQYVQGQHITLKAEIDGQDVRRSYSICHSVQSQKLTVGIKKIENGLFSGFANKSLKTGMTLEVMPPQGHFFTELSESHSKHYLMLAVGSGITPMLSHVESILKAEPNSIVTLVYGNKSTPLMMFRDVLSFTKNRYLSRFNWVNLFTQEENDAEVFNGRISAEKLIDLHKARVVNLDTVDEVFLCGPETMINSVNDFLKANSFKPEQIHYELFFAGASAEKANEKLAERVKKFGEKTSKVSVKVAGRKILLDLAVGGDNILDAAMESGADLPFSCKGGVCATCKAKVVSGDVEMDMNHSLTPEEVAEGMVLTCQAHPISDEVEIDFDLIN